MKFFNKALKGRKNISIIFMVILVASIGAYSLQNPSWLQNLVQPSPPSPKPTTPVALSCAAIGSTGLVAWWQAEGNPTDSSGNNINGAFMNGATASAPAKVGLGAFQFNPSSNDYIQVPWASALGPSQITVDAWVRTSSAQAWTYQSQSGNIEFIVSELGVGGGPLFYGYALTIGNSPNGPGRLRFTLYAGWGGYTNPNVGTYGDAFGTSMLSSMLLDGNWHHVAGTYDGANIILYVDGVQDGPPVPYSGGITYLVTNPLQIGARTYHYPNGYFDGRIDDLEIWSRPLPQNEIQMIYSAGSAGKCPTTTAPCVLPPSGLKAWWPLDETSGTTVTDIIGGHNGMTLPGAIGAFAGPGPVSSNTWPLPTFPQGMVGTSLFFYGNRYIKVPSHTDLEPGAGDFTVDAWVIYAGGSGQWLTIVRKWGASGPGYRFIIEDVPGGKLFIQTGQFITSPNLATVPFTPGVWHHVAAVVKRGPPDTLTLYIDGTPFPSAAGLSFPSLGNVVNTEDLLIGGDGVLAGEIAVDEVEIFKVALTQQQIQDIYNAGAAGKCKQAPPTTGLVHCPPTGTPPIDLSTGTTGTTQPFIADAYSTLDPHWSVISAPTGYSLGAAYSVTPVPQWVGGTTPNPYVGPGNQANWIRSVPSVSPQLGVITYQSTGFTGPGTLIINGLAADDGVDLYLSPTLTLILSYPVPAFYSLLPSTPPLYVAVPTGAHTLIAKVTQAVDQSPFGLLVIAEFCPGMTPPPPPQNATICVTKFNDLNGNGVQDPGEPQMQGWTIQIKDPSGNVVGTITTGTLGTPPTCVSVPAPATYTVSEVLQAGWIQTAPTPVPPGTHTVTVSSGQLVNLSFGNRHPKIVGGEVTPPVLICDLKITKTVDPPNPSVNQPVYITIKVQNVGNAPCPGPTTVTDTLPSGITFGSFAQVASGWTCTPAISCTTSTTLAPGPPITVVVAQVTMPSQPGSIQNCATVTNANDANPANNTSCVTIQVAGKCDLQIRKSVSPNPVQSGGTVTITLTVMNVGMGPCPGGAGTPGTTVQDIKPAGLTFNPPVTVSPPGWACSFPAGNLLCNHPLPLPVGYVATFTFTATVTAPAGSNIQNCATVSNPGDINPANNQSCVTIIVTGKRPPPTR